MGNGITNCYPDEVGKFISITVLTAAGVREIERATVDAAALVPSGEYAQATAEVRSKREVRLWL